MLKLTWESLQELPVSDLELSLELEKRNAFLYKNSFRILDSEYLNQILTLIKLSVIEYSLDWDNLSWNSLQILSVEHEIPIEILAHVLTIISIEFYQDENKNDKFYKVSQEEWGKIVAENGFINSNWSGLILKVFLKKWKELVPEDFKVDVDWLKGNSFVENDKINYFPKSVLEVDPKQRFSQLFQAKKKWNREELIPFLHDILTEKDKGFDTLLVKWTRKIKDGNLVYYVAR